MYEQQQQKKNYLLAFFFHSILTISSHSPYKYVYVLYKFSIVDKILFIHPLKFK